MMRNVWTILAGIVFWAGVSGLPDDVRSEVSAGGRSEMAAPAYLKPVQVRSLPEGVQVILGFQGKGRWNPRVDEGTLSYGEGWTQIQIPGTVIDPPKQSLRLERGPLTEVFAYQFTPEAVRVRLYHRDPRSDGRGRISLKPESGGVVVTVMDRMLPTRDPFVPPATSRKAAVPAAESAKSPAGILVKGAVPAAAPEETTDPGPASSASATVVGASDAALPTVPPSPESAPAATDSVENFRLPGKTSESPAPFALGEGAPDLLSTSLKMVLALVLVLLLMGGCVYVFKRTLGRRMGLGGGKDRHIRILSSAYLGPKKNIVLVEVAGETLVLGVSGERISLLSRILPEGERMPEAPAPHVPEEPGADPRFDRMLRSIGGEKVTLGDDLWSSKES